MIGSNKRVLASEILSAETSKLIRCPPRKRIKKIDIYDHVSKRCSIKVFINNIIFSSTHA
jgi:hypothetical protein